MRIRGVVSSGLGRAHIFMSKSHYQDQFKRILGKTAWPGTLNLSVEGGDFINHLALRLLAGLDSKDVDSALKVSATEVDTSALQPRRVEGFQRDGISFGGATAFLADIIVAGTDLPCAVLIPDLTRHIDVVEVIAGLFLREHLDLVDGDVLNLVIHA